MTQAYRLQFAILIFCLPLILQTQTIDDGQNPPGTHWKKIETPHYEIVFPREISTEGNRVANTLEHLYSHHSKTLKTKRRRITIFLTNRGVIANGYVTLAPRKAEWFHQPTQGNMTGSNEWYRLLAVHEGRHMVQFDAENSGLTRLVGWLTGESGVLGLTMFSIPLWWFEGDAVGIETAFTRSGRGRIPEFGLGLRTLLLNGKGYGYPKMYIGSYRDWTPNWYELGYHLVAHTRQKYGPDIWGRVIKRTSKWSIWPFSFSNALKKETGKGLTGLYQETLSELENAWRDQIHGKRFTAVRTINPEPKSHTRYWFPQYLKDRAVIVQKYGFDDPFSLVVLDGEGHEKRLKQIFPLEPSVTRGSAAAGQFIWDESISDIRWGQRQYSSLVILNITTGQTRRILSRCRYFNPALSPDGGRIAAVEYTTERCANLVILDTETGCLIRQFPNPNNFFFQSPAWSPDGRFIVFTFQSDAGKGIAILNTESGVWREIMPAQWRGISNPVLFDRFVLFSSPQPGIDNIHAIEIETGTEYQATSVPYGAFSPQVSPDGKQILFSNYSLKGLEVCEMDFDPSAWSPIDSASVDATGYVETLAAQEGGPFLDDSQIPAMRYPIQDYHPFSHLLNVHSWLPVSDSRKFGLMFYSKDKLNTLSLAAGPVIDRNEEKLGVEAYGTYAGWFPMIDFGLRLTGREMQIADSRNRLYAESWAERSVNLGARIPLDLSRGIYTAQLQLGTGISMIHVSERSVQPNTRSDGTLIPLQYEFEFSRIRDGAVRDVAPSWGQMFQAVYRHTPFTGDFNGAQFLTQAALYVPGIMRHHSFSVQAAWEEQKTGSYLFPTSFSFSRGYDAVFYKRLAFASASYTFPLLYPDFALGNWVYLKRIKGRLFYDYTLGQDGQIEQSYRSAGMEMGFETHFFNFKFPLELGVRWVYRIDAGDSRIEPTAFVDIPLQVMGFALR